MYEIIHSKIYKIEDVRLFKIYNVDSKCRDYYKSTYIGKLPNNKSLVQITYNSYIHETHYDKTTTNCVLNRVLLIAIDN